MDIHQTVDRDVEEVEHEEDDVEDHEHEVLKKCIWQWSNVPSLAYQATAESDASLTEAALASVPEKKHPSIVPSVKLKNIETVELNIFAYAIVFPMVHNL